MAPSMSRPFFCHWYWNTPTPTGAVSSKALPALSVRLAGRAVSAGPAKVLTTRLLNQIRFVG